MADFTPYLSCTRASTGYAQTVAGTLTSFAANTLRRTDKGLLVEEAKTNLCKQSETPNIWGVENVTTTADTTVAPNGTTTADTIADTASNTFHRFYRGGDVVVTAGVHTGSIYIKAGTISWFQLLLYDGTAYWANFNVATGTTGNKSAGVTSLMEPLANGWYRCIVTATLVTGSHYFMCYLSNSDSATQDPVYVGSGSTLHAWGGQVEAGSYASSYIPTTSAAATRAADALTFVGDADVIFDGAAASVVASMDVTPKTAQLAIVRSGTEVMLYKPAATSVANLSTAGSGALTKSGLVSGLTTAGKYGSAWTRSGGRSVTGQGLTVATDASVLVPGATIYLGSSDGSADALDGYIKRLTLWNTRITDGELEEATADEVAGGPSLDFSDQANSQYLPLL